MLISTTIFVDPDAACGTLRASSFRPRSMNLLAISVNGCSLGLSTLATASVRTSG